MSDPKENDPKPDVIDDAALAPFFAAAEQARVDDLSDDLMARILADAAAQQETPQPEPRSLGVMGWFAEIRDGLGGWSALAGLGTAMVAGVWIGGTEPDWAGSLSLIGADTTVSDQLADEDLELIFPSYDDYWGET